MEGKEGRTEPATPKRRAEKRRKGQLCISQEVETVAALFFGFLGLRWAVPHIGPQLTSLWVEINRIPVGADIIWDAARIHTWFKDGGAFLAILLVPIVVPIMLATIIANIAQTGPFLSLQTLDPKWNALNPVNGIRKLFSLNSLFNLGMSLLKVLLIVGVLYVILHKQIPTLINLSAWPVESFSFWLIRMLFLTAITVVIIFIVLAAIDYVYQHYNYEKSLLMTKKEVEDEHKNQELPAVVKGAQRRKMRDLTLARMMASVPEANLVVTNPTHVAVALRYDPEKMNAPVVTAKGLRLIAERIKEIARENGVPILEKPEVARNLYKYVKVGQPIPSQFFGAVAEILAYLYKLGNKRIRQTVELGRANDGMPAAGKVVKP